LSASATDKNIHAFMLATTTPFSCASCKQTQPGTEGDALTKYVPFSQRCADRKKHSRCTPSMPTFLMDAAETDGPRVFNSNL